MLPREQEQKYASPSTLNNALFFSPKNNPTADESTSLALIDNLGSVEMVEEFIKMNPIQSYECLPSMLAKIKKLHRYVIENNVEAVEQLLRETPDYLLPVLLKTKSINKTSAKGIRNHIMVEGTALRMALGAEATGREEGCDLRLIPSPFEKENTTLKNLALYSDDDPHSPFYYFFKDEKIIIQRTNFKNYWESPQENAAHFDELKKMFRNPLLCHTNLNLDHPNLTEAQRDAYAALLQITYYKNKHTLFVKQKGMVSLLQEHLKRALPGEAGEQEIAKQTLDQFPEKYAEEEKAQYEADFKVLKDTQKIMLDLFLPWNDPKIMTALDEFRKYFEPKEGDVLRTGKYGKNKLFLAALKFSEYENSFSRSDVLYGRAKDNLWLNQAVGWLQRLAQDNVKQDMSQGLMHTRCYGKKSNHSLKYTDEYNLVIWFDWRLEQEKTIEIRNSQTVNGLEYRVIGLDKTEKQGTILWKDLSDYHEPSDWYGKKTAASVVCRQDQYLPEILKLTSQNGHTHAYAAHSDEHFILSENSTPHSGIGYDSWIEFFNGKLIHGGAALIGDIPSRDCCWYFNDLYTSKNDALTRMCDEARHIVMNRPHLNLSCL